MRTNRSPLSPLFTLEEATKPAVGSEPRASLAGLEVSEAAIQEWLAAGGERRKQPRPPLSLPPTKAGR